MSHLAAVAGRGRRAPRWAVDGTAAGARVRRDRARVEGRFLDVMAHRDDGHLAVRVDLEERAAALEPEEAAIGVLERVAAVHVRASLRSARHHRRASRNRLRVIV